jgi:hypothetical protein
MSLHKCLDCESMCHSLMRGLTLKGSAHALSQLTFMVSLNNPCWLSKVDAKSISGTV